jgi:hypothetical protein
MQKCCFTWCGVTPCLPDTSSCRGEALLRCADLSWFHIVVVIPHQKAGSRKSEPNCYHHGLTLESELAVSAFVPVSEPQQSLAWPHHSPNLQQCHTCKANSSWMTASCKTSCTVVGRDTALANHGCIWGSFNEPSRPTGVHVICWDQSASRKGCEVDDADTHSCLSFKVFVVSK